MANNLLDKSSIILTPTAYNNGEALCVKPSDGSGDFDFSRNSAATRVNAQGLVENVQSLGSELITNGDFATDSDWSLNGWNISGGTANNDGVNTGNINQNIGLQQNKFYKISITITNYVSGALNVRLGTGTQIEVGSANGEYTLYLENTTTNPNIRFYPDATLNFNGSIDNVSVKEVIDNTNLPRINYEGFSYDGSGNIIPDSGCGSWLFEPQSTNLVPYSSDFTQWTPNGTPTITSNYGISPNGTQNSTRVQFDTDERIRSSLSASGDITFSVYLKGSGVLTLRDNTNVYRQDVTLTSEWARYDLSFNATITSVQIQNQTASIVDLEIWGAQVEQQSYATSYIPTNGEANGVTRNQDVCNNGGSLATINSTEGVLYAEIAALADDLTFRSISLSDGSSNNVVTIRYRTSSNRIQVVVFSGGVLQFSNSFDVTNILDFNKVAISYNQSDFNYWVNGVKRANSTSGNTPIGLNQVIFAQGDIARPFFGKTKALAVWKEALSDSELTELTTI